VLVWSPGPGPGPPDYDTDTDTDTDYDNDYDNDYDYDYDYDNDYDYDYDNDYDYDCRACSHTPPPSVLFFSLPARPCRAQTGGFPWLVILDCAPSCSSFPPCSNPR
jgi:hypothetical protein